MVLFQMLSGCAAAAFPCYMPNGAIITQQREQQRRALDECARRSSCDIRTRPGAQLSPSAATTRASCVLLSRRTVPFDAHDQASLFEEIHKGVIDMVRWRVCPRTPHCGNDDACSSVEDTLLVTQRVVCTKMNRRAFF